MTTAKEILVNARELISDPAHWIKGKFAEDSRGREVSPGDADATCWCSLGAIERSTVTPAATSFDEVRRAMDTWIRTYTTSVNIVSLNDATETTHEDVLTALDGAIKLLETAQ